MIGSDFDTDIVFDVAPLGIRFHMMTQEDQKKKKEDAILSHSIWVFVLNDGTNVEEFLESIVEIMFLLACICTNYSTLK